MTARVADAKARLASVDIARGIAVLGMFGFHLTWDLAHFGFIDASRPFAPLFRLYSHVVASAFLFLAGASLVLARRHPFRWTAWARHVGTICVAAALVTLASFVLFPDGLIGFGILHCIAAALVVATPFLFLPPIAALLAALVIAAAPLVVQTPSFNIPALIWTGLGTIEPRSNDFRAFFPWAAPTFAGLAAMAFGARHGLVGALGRWTPSAAPWRALAFGGRHSLAIYLAHQPLFFGALAALAAVMPVAPGSAERGFARQCQAQCTASGALEDTCRSACACAARQMRVTNLWDRAVANALDDAGKLALSRIAQRCLRDPS